MAIVRIEGLVYGVEDMLACTRFNTDAGFECVRADAGGALFRTPVNQWIELRSAADPALPAAAGASAGLREIIWGVDSASGLAAIHRELSKDRAVTVDAQGTLHTHDETGYGIAFRVAEIAPPPPSVRAFNSPSYTGRLNERLSAIGHPQPIRIIHVALDVPDAGHDAANDFYLKRLGFKAIDDSRTVGIFMQCEGDLIHHNLLLVHRSDRKGINHICLEMLEFDAVMEAGNFMTEHGWKESRRLGRHTLGSNLFRFYHSPCGGRIEFAFDMDRMDKSWQTRVWEKAPPHHLWLVKFPGDAERESNSGGG
jgi:catechol 2,3-dioxygenase-like lactoylglutathione lyase family enzyme